MSRFAKWVTLTPEERSQVTPAFSDSGAGATSTGLVKQYTCSVPLPDGTACEVGYTRYNAQSHRFEFASPISQNLYSTARLAASVEAIEEKARELAPQAFREAQREEQKRMRRPTPPPGHRKPTNPPQMRAKNAEAVAGKYAVCLRFRSGNLLPLGPLHEEPEGASEELREGKHSHTVLQGGQEIVIGICCRWERRWKQAQFVVSHAPEPQPPDTVDAGASSPAVEESTPLSPGEETPAPPPPLSKKKRGKSGATPTEEATG